jgi:iron complex transport system substrate-binding protein
MICQRLWSLLFAIGLSIWISIWFVGASAGEPPNMTVARTPSRIVSLAPSNTELLYSLGAEDQLVAVSDVCDFPPQAKDKPKAGSFVNARVETILRFKPSKVVLVSGQEAICATLQKFAVPSLLLKNEHLWQIGTNLKELGNVTGRTDVSARLAAGFDDSLNQLKQIVAKSRTRPRVFVCVWPEPLITAGGGSFMHESITVCGGTNIAGDLSAAFPRMNTERLIAGKPEIMVMAAQAKSQDFWKKSPWTSTPAFRAGKIYFLPEGSKDPLVRPTLRIVDGLYWLSGILHPELAGELKQWKKQTDKRLVL